MNQKHAKSDKKNIGRPRKKPDVGFKTSLCITGVDLSTKEILSRQEVMVYLRCGKSWLHDQYRKEGGLFLRNPGCVKKDGRRVFFVREKVDEAIRNLPDYIIG